MTIRVEYHRQLGEWEESWVVVAENDHYIAALLRDITNSVGERARAADAAERMVDAQRQA